MRRRPPPPLTHAITFLAALAIAIAVPATPAFTAVAPARRAPAAAPGTSGGPAHALTVRRAPATAECGSLPAPLRAVTEAPWPQLRYPPARLAPLSTGQGVTVAVIDSGVDPHHPQLRGQVLPGADFLDPGGNGTTACNAHGTAVASIIAATAVPGVRFQGLAPQAKILPVRVSEQQIIGGRESGRTVSAAQFAKAIRWAVDHGADVVNLSVVLYQDHPAVHAAVAYAVQRDVVVVAAVGNLHDNGDPVPYPAAYEGVLGVGAVGPDGIRSRFSQVGPYVDVVAPGSDVLAAVPGGGHRTFDGTSYAAPFVSAAVALVRAYRPDLSAAEVLARIRTTADPAPAGAHSAAYGAGVLDPYRAVTDTDAGRIGTRVAGPLPAAHSDPNLVARQRRRSHAMVRSLSVAAAGGLVVGVVLLLVVVLPSGRRRRWRPADAG